MADDYTTKKKKMMADAERERAAKEFLDNERSMGRIPVGVSPEVEGVPRRYAREEDQTTEDGGTRKLETLEKMERNPLESIDMRQFEPMKELSRTKKLETLEKMERKPLESIAMRQFEPMSESVRTGELEELKRMERKPLTYLDMRQFEPMSESVRTKDAMNRDKLNTTKK
jgi:hypothetical protein